MSILPAELSTGTVHGRFIVAVIDGHDADQEPEVIPATGRIVFKASVGYIPVPSTNEGPVTVMKGPITGVLDGEGYLSTPHPTTGEPMYRGVKLLATDDPDMAVTDWTWAADYRFESVNGVTLQIPAHSFALPSNSVVDLTTMVKVPSSPGYGLPQAEAAVLRAEAAAIEASASADVAVQGASTTDGLIAGIVSDPSTQTSTALSAAIGGQVSAATADIVPTRIDENLPQARTEALRPVMASFGNRDYAQCNMVFWGTSMTEGGPVGVGAGPAARWRRWLDKLAVNLRSRMPLHEPVAGSVGYIPAYLQTFFGGGTSENSRVRPDGVTYSSPTLVGYGSGLGARSLGLTAAGEWVQFSFTGDAFDLFLSTHTTAGTIVSISVDGGVATDYALPASNLTSDRYRITGLTVGTHTVRATWKAGVAVVDGLMPYNGDASKGIHVWDAGRGSAKITDVGTVAAFRGFKQMGIIAPSLVGIEYGYNEYFGNVPVATFKTNLQSFTDACKANTPAACTFLFIIWPTPKHANTPVAPWSDYATAIREVAANTVNGVVVDMSERVMSALESNTLGFFYTDLVHASDKGAAYAADVLAETITPR